MAEVSGTEAKMELTKEEKDFIGFLVFALVLTITVWCIYNWEEDKGLIDATLGNYTQRNLMMFPPLYSIEEMVIGVLIIIGGFIVIAWVVQKDEPQPRNH